MGRLTRTAGAVLVALLLLAGQPAVAGTAPAAAGAWAWPLDASSGIPRVLRRADLPTRSWQPGHRGVDLAAAPGQEVLAPVDGVVVVAGRVAGRGVVSIATASGWRATLEPVDALVRVGDPVSRGRPVGVLSSAGPGAGHCAPASCLHWGVRSGSGSATVYRDPLSLLRVRVVLLPVPGWGISSPRRASRASR